MSYQRIEVGIVFTLFLAMVTPPIYALSPTEALPAGARKVVRLQETREFAEKIAKSRPAMAEILERIEGSPNKLGVSREQEELFRKLSDPNTTEQEREIALQGKETQFFDGLNRTRVMEGADITQTDLYKAAKQGDVAPPAEIAEALNHSARIGAKQETLLALSKAAGPEREQEAVDWIAAGNADPKRMREGRLDYSIKALKEIGDTEKTGVAVQGESVPRKLSAKEVENLREIEATNRVFSRDAELESDGKIIARARDSANGERSVGGLVVLGQHFKSAAVEARANKAHEMGLFKDRKDLNPWGPESWKKVNMSPEKLEAEIKKAAIAQKLDPERIMEEIENTTGKLFVDRLEALAKAKPPETPLPISAIKTIMDPTTKNPCCQGYLQRAFLAHYKQAAMFAGITFGTVAVGATVVHASTTDTKKPDVHAGTAPAKKQSTQIADPNKD